MRGLPRINEVSVQSRVQLLRGGLVTCIQNESAILCSVITRGHLTLIQNEVINLLFLVTTRGLRTLIQNESALLCSVITRGPLALIQDEAVNHVFFLVITRGLLKLI